MALLPQDHFNPGMNNETKCQMWVIYAITECFYV